MTASDSDSAADSAADSTAPRQRLGRLIERRDGRDFPFYAGNPVGLSRGRWLVVCVACLVAFLVLILFPRPNPAVGLVPQILFPAIVLAAFAWAAGPRWTALFRRVRAADVGLMVLFAALNLAVTFAVAGLVSQVFTVSANPELGSPPVGVVDRVIAYVGAAIQLLGEELVTILPFFALLHVLTARGTLSRNAAVVVSWIVTAVWFGALHLPTYDWNVAQALIVIGVARLVLTLAYIRTKNLWVSTGAHIVNDWVLLTVSLGGAG